MDLEPGFDGLVQYCRELLAWGYTPAALTEALHVAVALRPDADTPPHPADDTRWQTLVHGAPVHASVLSCCGDLQRTDLPAFLALLRPLQELWPAGAELHLVLSDPDGTLTLDTVTGAVGPHVTVAIVS